MEWRPIETCPEELVVDVWLAPEGKVPCRVTNVHRDQTGRWYGRGNTRIWGRITHWMLPPAPPEHMTGAPQECVR